MRCREPRSHSSVGTNHKHSLGSSAQSLQTLLPFTLNGIHRFYWPSFRVKANIPGFSHGAENCNNLGHSCNFRFLIRRKQQPHHGNSCNQLCQTDNHSQPETISSKNSPNFTTFLQGNYFQRVQNETIIIQSLPCIPFPPVAVYLSSNKPNDGKDYDKNMMMISW